MLWVIIFRSEITPNDSDHTVYLIFVLLMKYNKKFITYPRHDNKGHQETNLANIIQPKPPNSALTSVFMEFPPLSLYQHKYRMGYKVPLLNKDNIL